MGILYDDFARAQRVYEESIPCPPDPVELARCDACDGRIFEGDDVLRIDFHVYCTDCVRKGWGVME